MGSVNFNYQKRKVLDNKHKELEEDRRNPGPVMSLKKTGECKQDQIDFLKQNEEKIKPDIIDAKEKNGILDAEVAEAKSEHEKLLIVKKNSMEEVCFSRIYNRGLLFSDIGIPSNIIYYCFIIEMTESFLKNPIKSEELPGEKELYICMMNFDTYQENQQALVTALTTKMELHQNEQVLIKKKDEKETLDAFSYGIV